MRYLLLLVATAILAIGLTDGPSPAPDPVDVPFSQVS